MGKLTRSPFRTTNLYSSSKLLVGWITGIDILLGSLFAIVFSNVIFLQLTISNIKDKFLVLFLKMIPCVNIVEMENIRLSPEYQSVIDQNFNRDDGPKGVCPGMYDYLKRLQIQGVKPKIIYDIGSCVGHWASIAHKIFPEAIIYCFEPNQDLYRVYETNENGELIIKGMEFTRVYPILLSDEDGREVNYHYSKVHIGGNSYYRENSPFFNEFVKMKTTRLDSVDIPPPDLVKIDVQGAELDVMKGGVEKLKNTRHLVVEMQHVDYNQGAPKVDEGIEYIRSLGFTYKEVVNDGPVDRDYAFANE